MRLAASYRRQDTLNLNLSKKALKKEAVLKKGASKVALNRTHMGRGNGWFKDGKNWFIRPRLRTEEAAALVKAGQYYLASGQATKEESMNLCTLLPKFNAQPFEDILNKEKQRNPNNPLLPVLESVVRGEPWLK